MPASLLKFSFLAIFSIFISQIYLHIYCQKMFGVILFDQHSTHNTNMNSTLHISKYKISRRGRKLQISDDPRTLVALPKEVPERTWAEILQKEENDLVVFDIREDLLERAVDICYQRYMERQSISFTAHCAAQAWLKIIDWQFYRHDPGEEPSSHPSCHIPHREASWQADTPPDPSPKDTWCRQELPVLEDTSPETLKRVASNSSIDMPVVDPIPKEYWFPGKVQIPRDDDLIDIEPYDVNSYETSSSDLAAESELLQRVTDYTEEPQIKESASVVKSITPVEGSLHGAGDSAVRSRKRLVDKSKSFSKASVSSRSRASVSPLVGESRSRLSVISDCRLRNLRLDTQYEVTSEKLDTPPGETIKRK